MVELEGVVERIAFRNEENFFTVVRLKVKDSGETVTAVGFFPSVSEGELIRIKGSWEIHEKHGYQLKVEGCETLIPATVREIENYLASGIIKGIGPVTARKIVEKFQEKALEVLDSKPELLLEIPGIGKKRLETIVSSFAEKKDIRNIMLFLQSHGVGASLAVKIYKAYGGQAVEVIKQNPYRLADEVYGIGFKTADKIARSLGIEAGAPERVAAGVLYALQQAAEEGHVFLPKAELLKRASSLLEVEEGLVEEVLPALGEKEEVVIDGSGEEREERIYSPAFYASEKSVARKLYLISGFGRMKPLDITEEEMAEIEERCNIKLAPKQKEALEKAASSGVLVITGGPGTGKTTLIKCLVEFFKMRGLKVALAAPTGRAAKRMAEATGMEASTIHRLLEYRASGGGGMFFGKNRENPLDEDVVIIDETSMVDIVLMHHLLSALKPLARLILVGDKDQLPSVGPGSVLKDVIASDRIPVVMLDEIFRQARESMIVVNAHRVNKGLFPYLNVKGRDFYFEQATTPEETLERVVELVSRRLPDFGGFDPMEDIQVITPMKKTAVGVLSLNLRLQDRLNPPSPGKREISFRSVSYREGDRVMQIKNNYEKEVFNGDLGRIVRIDDDERVLVSFPDAEGERIVPYAGDELEELTLSYALSVHKSQGSEFPVVVMPLVVQHYVMLQRNLLYTAITRAKKLMVLVGSKQALTLAVRNSRALTRYSFLSERIKQEFEVEGWR